MRFITVICIMALLATLQSSPVLAQSYNASANDIPLVIIRYNQSRVYYSKQLYNAISRAVAIKPDLTVSVVSFVPDIGSDSQKERIRQIAAQQRNKLLADLKQMGIPDNHLNVTTEYVTDARFHEVYIYVD